MVQVKIPDKEMVKKEDVKVLYRYGHKEHSSIIK